MEEVADLLAVNAHEKGLEFACLIDPDLPELLRGDAVRLRQILINLAGNAIKFTPTGEVTLSAAPESTRKGTVTIRFTIRDTGIGIPSDRFDRLFQPFSQLDASTTRKYGGTGLGLTISKRLVEMMGGEIHVASEEGKGSTFSFTAPFARRKGITAATSVLAPPEGIRERRVLIVDNNDTARYVLREQLTAWGCRAGEAASGSQALEALRGAEAEGDPYWLTLIDMEMPEIDGETLGELILKDEAVGNTRLVMLASIDKRGETPRLVAKGFCGCLTKPVRTTHLMACLKHALEWSAAERPDLTAENRQSVNTLADVHDKLGHILVAEDNLVNRKVAINLLEKNGFKVHAAVNGNEAVAALEKGEYDLVLMDVQMPGMDGIEATAAIRTRELETGRHTPIIAMTAHAMAGDRERCLAAGMDDYITKPINTAELLSAIKRWTGIQPPKE